MRRLSKQKLDQLDPKVLKKVYIIPNPSTDFLAIGRFELKDMYDQLEDEEGPLFVNIEALDKEE